MLDTQTKALLDQIAENPAPKLWELSPAGWREQLDAFFAETGLEPADGVGREDRCIPGLDGTSIRLRLYRPEGAPAEPLPGLLYFHGGGMVANSIETYDALVSHLCAQSGMVMIAAIYRLAPENPFPSGVDDAHATAVCVHENAASLGVDQARLAIGGDSAGGYLTAVVTQLLQDTGGPEYVFQLLIYPAVGTRGHSFSMAEFATGYLFEREELDWIYKTYTTDPDQTRDPRVCPILAEDFDGLPPAFVLTVGHDIMRDDSEHYAELLRKAGVAAEVSRYETTIHPFLNMAGVIDAGREAIAECAAKVREALDPGTFTPLVDPASEETPHEGAFENEHVRVFQIVPGDGQEPSPRDPETPMVRVGLNGVSVRCDGKFPPEAADSVEQEVWVEVKSAPEHSEPGELDAVALDPDRYRVEFEDERVRMVRLRFEPGEQGSMVAHPSRVLVTLTDVHVKVAFPDGSVDERQAPAGIAGWLTAETVQMENLADEPLEVVLVEPKGHVSGVVEGGSRL